MASTSVTLAPAETREKEPQRISATPGAAQGLGPKQEPIIKGGKGKGKKSSEASGKVPKAKAKADAGPALMEVDAPAAQPKKTWVAIAVEGAWERGKAKMTLVPKAEPKGKAASVPEAKSAQAPGDEAC